MIFKENVEITTDEESYMEVWLDIYKAALRGGMVRIDAVAAASAVLGPPIRVNLQEEA